MKQREAGQTMIEFGIIATVMFVIIIGLVDAGRAVFEFNSLSSLARYAGRWAVVVGYSCDTATSASDWCDQMGQAGTQPFWSQPGNVPRQTGGASCPTVYDESTYSGDYYTASDYSAGTASTIVGAIAHRLDSSQSGSNFLRAGFATGFDLSRLKVCIQLPGSWVAARSMYLPRPGDAVGVVVYYPYFHIGSFIPGTQLNLVASSQYQIT